MHQLNRKEPPPAGVLLLTVGQVADLCNVGVATVWRWAKDKRYGFPEPLKLDRAITRWKAKEVREWVDKVAVNS